MSPHTLQSTAGNFLTNTLSLLPHATHFLHNNKSHTQHFNVDQYCIDQYNYKVRTCKPVTILQKEADTTMYPPLHHKLFI